MNAKQKGSSGKKEVLDDDFCLLILSGLPGSGKSTIATQLEKNGWIRVNQDDLGSSDECKKALEKALKHKRSAILDRCNAHSKDRKMWINEAKKYTNNVEVNANNFRFAS
jgi:predicted kinase